MLHLRYAHAYTISVNSVNKVIKLLLNVGFSFSSTILARYSNKLGAPTVLKFRLYPCFKIQLNIVIIK
jgi:hypothetical protein